MRRLALVAALLAALFVAPATASAASGCGSTAAQWLDTFTGTETSGTSSRTTVTEITDGPVVNQIAPYNPGSPYASWFPDESPDLVDGTPSWTVNYSEYFPFKGNYYEERDYTVTQVTCTGGEVSAFSGTFLKTMIWNGTSTQVESFTVHK